MTPGEACHLIAAAGGDTEFAKLLGIEKNPRFQQRVNNWKRRGIPSEIELAHLDVIQKLRRQIGKKTRAATSEARCE